MDTATPPSLSLGPLIFNGYSHTTKEKSRLFKTPHHTTELVLARENLRVKEHSRLNFI